MRAMRISFVSHSTGPGRWAEGGPGDYRLASGTELASFGRWMSGGGCSAHTPLPDDRFSTSCSVNAHRFTCYAADDEASNCFHGSNRDTTR